MRPALPALRLEWLVAAVLALLLAGTAAVVAEPGAPAASTQPDPGCTRAFPTRITPPGERLYESAVGRLVICEDDTGTATLLRNATAAVWLVEAPRGVAVHRERGSAVERSFLSIIEWPSPALPPGARIAVPVPASQLSVRVDPRLTIAALAHERLASFLLGSAPLGARGTALPAARVALASCISELLDTLPRPDAVLAGGNPSRRIADAALEVASSRDSSCVREWIAARRDIGMQGARVAPLEQDITLWFRDPTFAFRALDAAITYSALGRRLFP